METKHGAALPVYGHSSTASHVYMLMDPWYSTLASHIVTPLYSYTRLHPPTLASCTNLFSSGFLALHF